MTTTTTIEARLAPLRQAIRDASISYGELVELQGLANEIPSDDLEMLQWAGVPEQHSEAECGSGGILCLECRPVIW